ncbi:MAG: alkaline phosphatase family protein [Chloroflexi bacterium]|nr:alkaline phosphatase family protein [Chloroflexota bacterium]
MSRVVVLGIDGATFGVLLPLARAGYLPHLQRLLALGPHCALRSTTPPYSAAAWVTFATGRNPGKHGIADFWRINPVTGQKTLLDAGTIASPSLWDYLSDQQRRVAVLNMPMTFPPRPINGILVAGMMTPEEKDGKGFRPYTYPPEVQSCLEGLPESYSPDPFRTVAQNAAFLRDAARWIYRQEMAHQRLLEQEPWDLFISVIQATDPVQHHFWRFMDGNHPGYDAVEAAALHPLLIHLYQAVDAVIGQRIDYAIAHNTNLLVVSDHGFGPAHHYFFVNRFLMDTGLLRQVAVHQMAVRQMAGTDKEARNPGKEGTKALGRLWQRGLAGLGSFVVVADRWKLRQRLMDNRSREAWRRRLDRLSAGGAVDWNRTRAYYAGLTAEGIFVNLKGREPQGIVTPGQEYEAVRQQVIDGLLALRDPQNGAPVVAAIYRREELYDGPMVANLPDVVFSMGNLPYLPSERLATPNEVVAPLPLQAGGGRHRPDGILLGVGPEMGPAGSYNRQGPVGFPLSSGEEIDDMTVDPRASIVDMAPTVLYLLGLPIPAEMDGKVLTFLLDPRVVAERSIQQRADGPAEGRAAAATGYSAEEAVAIEERLRSLGYLD